MRRWRARIVTGEGAGMSELPTADEVALWQKRLAGQANNRAWTLAEQLSRSAAEDDEMLQAAHAAMYFWAIVGDASQQAHAAQLLGHVYGLLNQPKEALRYLSRSEPLFFAESAETWERALAYVVAANVAAAKADLVTYQVHFDRATEEMAQLASDDERGIVHAALQAVPVPPRR